MCMLPATISNNVPGTDLSLGADTALNAIVEVRRGGTHPAGAFCSATFKTVKTEGEVVGSKTSSRLASARFKFE